MVLTELLDSPRDVALVMGLDFGTYSSGIACHVVPGGSLAAQMTPAGPYAFVHSFKLHLAPPAGDSGMRSLPADLPPLPAGMRVAAVVGDFLKLMRRHTTERLRAMLGCHVDPATIRWVVTVPAHWEEAAKDIMRSAAVRAGLAESHDQLLMTFEPEAAALAATFSPGPALLPRQAGLPLLLSAGAGAGPRDIVPLVPRSWADPGNRLAGGDVVLVVDVGGGTSDLTMHRVMRGEGIGLNLRLEEVVRGSGDFHAGARVDDAFERLCSQAFINWATFKAHDAGGYHHLMQRWQDSKRTFDGTNSITLPVLAGLHMRQGAAGMAVTPTGPVLSAVHLRQLYDPTIDGIIEQAQALCRKARADSGVSCNKVLLVGGFCNSRYAQARLQTALCSASVECVLPPAPEASVVAGAVLYGMQPGTITARYSRSSYGVAVCKLLTPELKAALGYNWQDAVFEHKETKEQWAKGIYDRFVKRDEKVYAEQVVEHEFRPTYSDAEAVGFSLFRTLDNDALRTTEAGMVEMASVSLPLPPGWNSSASWVSSRMYSLKVALHFGGTELRVRAIDVQTGRSVAATVAYER